MRLKHIAGSLFTGAVLAMPLGGFVFGFIHCEDCGFNLFARAFIGLVFTVLTPLCGGFPPQNEGGSGPSFNAWPHILITWPILSCCVLYFTNRRDKKRMTKQASTLGLPQKIPDR